MTFLLLAGFGVSFSGCFVHLVLGLSRRPNWKHLAFASTLAFGCAYFIYERRFYAAASVDEGIEVARDQLWPTIGYVGCFAWFMQRYAGARFPRAIVSLFYAALGAALVYNQLAPWALYYSSRPTLKTVTGFGGEPVHMLVAPFGLIPLLWYLLNLSLMVTAIVCGVRLARRGQMLSGTIFTVAVALSLLGMVVDFVHEIVHATWPYVSEYGLVGMVTVLSVQLAVDYRSQETELENAFASLKKYSDRVAFLSESTLLFSTSLEYQRVLDSLSSLAVRRLADWCVIDALEDGRLTRVSGAHTDPAKAELIKQLIERFPPNPEGSPAAIVMSTRRPLLLPSVSEEQLRSMAANKEHAAVVRALGSGSAIAVPLRARDQVLGVLSLVSARPGRYGEEDCQLAEELAVRAALAIDNARLYRVEQESVRGRDEFLTAASHEMRTPVASLMLAVQTLLIDKEALPDGFRKSAELINRQAVRMGKLINDMMSVGKIGLGRLDLHLVETDLGALAKDVVERMSSSLSRAGCEVILRSAENVRGQWDHEKLDQVVTNLLSNAMKFGAGKPIEVVVGQEGSVAKLVVIDHGTGIDAESMPRIFEKFERGKAAMPHGGLGLGLYITRTIVEAMGGTIGAESEPARETRFTVTLPTVSPARP